MQSFTLSAVPGIIFGAGKISEIGAKAAALAGRGASILVIADPALGPLGITARALSILAAAGLEARVYDGLKGEPKLADIDAAAALARDMGARAIIGLGGGSALDTAKLVACCAVTAKSAAAYQLCETPLPTNRLPRLPLRLRSRTRLVRSCASRTGAATFSDFSVCSRTTPSTESPCRAWKRRTPAST